ncbi:MAG: phenylalanine--tRNA ligase subunit beta [Candidatus Sabulitectum sp.]|nr:phenylalanine--tRNA ligase subunit beta [Candidatus Sabulitectum sp.]
MPKIEIPLADFLPLAGLENTDDLEKLLESLKAELDGLYEKTVKIELNDTNRPDLWTAEGVARGLRCWKNGAESHLDSLKAPEVHIDVHSNLKDIRPFIAAFTATGWKVDEDGLESLITAQEKITAGFGKERKTAAIGFYPLEGISFPVRYETTSTETSFQPLGEETEMTLAEILEKTETGMKYADILKGFKEYPILKDRSGAILSFPPVLNSHITGKVTPGDSGLFCEVTGTDWHTVNLTATILACNLEDRGAVISPVEIRYPHGEVTVTPVIYRDTLTASFKDISRMIGIDVKELDLEVLLSKMDYGEIEMGEDSVTAVMPPYRRDGIHPRDLMEDIVIAIGLGNMGPILPSEYTVGSAAPVEILARSVKALLVGAGCEEIMRPILTSFEKISTLTRTPELPIRISNPMTAEYGVVSNTLLPALLEVESSSGHAAFPHRLFTVGEILCRRDNSLCETQMNLAVSIGDGDFGEIHSILGIICHLRGLELSLKALDDPRFIPGRSAAVVINGGEVGILGEFHPGVLETWGITVPVAGFELPLESLRV